VIEWAKETVNETKLSICELENLVQIILPDEQIENIDKLVPKSSNSTSDNNFVIDISRNKTRVKRNEMTSEIEKAISPIIKGIG
jgi:predicted ATP-binding protein involved in virulence